MDIQFNGLKELTEAMEKANIKSEKRIRKHLNAQGRKFIEVAKDNTPSTGSGKRPIIDSYVSMQIAKNFKDYDKPIRNKAPHHHLVNNGHRLVKGKRKKVIGYVPGVRYIEKTIAQTEGDFHADTSDFLNELYEELLE